MACNLFIEATDVTRKLKEVTGDNSTLYSSYITEIMEGEDVSSDFKVKLKEKTGIDFDDIPNDKLDTVVDYIKEYYNSKKLDTDAVSKLKDDNDLISRFGYNSVAARQLAQKVSIATMLSVYSQLLNDNSITIEKYLAQESKKYKRKITKKEFFANIVTAFFKKEIIKRLESKGIADRQTIMQLFKNNDTAALERLFENTSLQDKNVLATYKEIIANRVQFFDEIFRNSDLQDIRFEKDENIEEDIIYEAIDEQLEELEVEEDSNTSSTDDKNHYIQNLTEKLGDYNNYMTHVDSGIRSYLSSLKKLHSGNKVNGNYDYDLDNELGIPDTMSAQQCCAVLYGYCDFTNVETMIKSIRDVANRLPGFAALHQLADRLVVDKNFAYKIRRTFGKIAISKLETISDGDVKISRVSNYNADKLSAFKFELFNSAKATSILFREVTGEELFNKINPLIEQLKANNDTINSITGSTKKDIEDINTLKSENETVTLNIIDTLFKEFHKFYPTLSDYSIKNYIEKANDGDIVGNCSKLLSILKRTVDASYKTQKQNDVRLATIGKLYSEKQNIQRQNAEGANISTRKIDEELESLFDQDYIHKDTRNAAFDLATELVTYSVVKIEFNNRNVNGNQSSSIINDSMMTNIIKTLQSNTALENFGKYKTQSRQYDFSNIMIEHRDENNKVINYGLFTQDPISKKLTPTSYAKDLLRVRLFDGASDIATNSNALYNQMSEKDYLATSFINYFNNDETYDTNVEGIAFANYFMRIPSDAPKNFVIRAPKYSVVGLLKKDANGNVTVNTNHRVFKQFKQIFVQELTDAATAIDTFFETKDGLVLVSDETDETSENYGKPKFKKGWDNSPSSARRMYGGYHTSKDADGNNLPILHKENGRWSLDKKAKVFKSDRFTITKVATEDIDYNGKHYKAGEVYTVNYGNDILAEAFNLLYGGASNSYIHTTTSDGGITVVLTAKQEEIINKYISQFITDYIAEAHKRMESYKELIPEDLYNATNIAEWVLNYNLMYSSFGDLFEGDTKFYKDSQTFLKRAKESQGSGVALGLANFDMDLAAPRALVDSELNNRTFIRTNPDGTTEEVQVGQYNKFRGVTIKNTIRTGETIGTFKRDSKGNFLKDENGNYQFDKIGVLSERYIKVLRESGMTLKNAKIVVANKMAGYADTTVNDAQSYITFEEWIRRVSARGQLDEYMPLIEAILDETKPVDAKTINAFVQVQKNFYYDQHYNPELHVVAPRQIKNAEFVLVPRFIKGTQLEQVYNMMKENGIDQLNTEETSKAGKTNVLTIWDNDGQITQKNIDDFNANAAQATELYNYNYLYTQQETPQHVAANNKAGIQLMKKIVDNIPENSELAPVKDLFFKLYCANIKQSYLDLMEELHIDLDENGLIKIDSEGNIVSLDLNLIYKRLEEEILRLGIDSNALDYVTLDETGSPLMPSFMSNFITKFENIAQSLFNSRITRQKLPGFHAAQITNVGWGAMSEQVQNRKYDKTLKYHPAQYQLTNGTTIISEREYNVLSEEDKKKYKNIGAAPYVEIMLPKSNFNLKRNNADGTIKTDEELLKELQDSGLDTIIGYRIPTEGKQSICVMKVVAFTDDALGSTIVVPDDWVAQTGSDFDIDSVYGVHFTSKINKKTGKIEKIKFKKENNEVDYINYIRARLNNKRKLKTNADIEELSKGIEETDTKFESLLEEESETYHSLPKAVREKIKEVQDTAKKRDANKNKHQRYVNQNNDVIALLEEEIKADSYSEKEKEAIRQHIDSRNAILNELKALTIFENKAKKLGLPTFEEYSSLSEIERNSRDARNNEILQCMIDILSSDLSLEENLARSNFYEITSANKDMTTANESAVRANRSPFNIFDQAKYQEDAMGGAKLKAFSVSRDTFCSVCNTVRPTLRRTIKVVYKAEDGYNAKQLRKSFGNVEEISEGVFVVEHNTFGWSKNNKNVDGFILTAYSSQTTAHILDAIKEGAIQNVNEYTFQVYKMFPDIGSNYRTAIAFMKQPGVTAIVNAYNKNKSIYAKRGRNPIKAAFRDIAIQLLKSDGISVSDKITDKDLIKKLQRYNVELARLFGARNTKFQIGFDNDHVANLLLSKDRMKERLENVGVFKTSSPVEDTRRKLLYDLGVVLQYGRLHGIGSSISDIARVCNPDKFGAKQSIFETEETLNEIETLAVSNNGSILQVNGKSFLRAVYPNVDNNINNFITASDEKSAYPPLYYFLKYATGVSIKINKYLFPITQDANFNRNIWLLDYLFSRGTLTKEVYKSFQNYILNYVYGQTTAIKQRATYDKERGFVFTDTNVDEERARIFGYNKTPSVEFKVNDINNPTQEEIEAFAELSPAQKVSWIQANSVNSGVFKYLRTSLFNLKRTGKAGAQTIQFVEGNDSIETVYHEFEKCYYSNNPLIALAALDLIKYSFVVEGFTMRKNAVNKVIRNTVLYQDFENGGTNIIPEINDIVKSLIDNTENMNKLRHNFIRSHSSIRQISTYYVPKDKATKKYELQPLSDGVILVERTELLEKYDIANESNGYFVFNQYVKLRFGNNTNLYKIEQLNDGAAFLYPVNILEETEYSEWSANASNNKHLSPEYYKMIYEDYNKEIAKQNEEIKFQDVVNAHKEGKEAYRFTPKKALATTYAKTFNINQKDSVNTGGFEDVISKVEKYFSENPVGSLYVFSPTIGKFIRHRGAVNGSVQRINGRYYLIQKADFSTYNRQYIENRQAVDVDNEQIRSIMEKAQKSNYKVNHAFLIEPINNIRHSSVDEITDLNTDEVRHSSAEEINVRPTLNSLGVKSMETMAFRSASQRDINAISTLRYLHDKGVTSTSTSVGDNIDEVIRVTSEYIQKSTEDIMDRLNHFVVDESNIAHSITEPEVIELIRKDPDTRSKFLEVILDARAFVKNFGIINELDITSESDKIKPFLKKIKESINDLENATIIAQAERIYIDEYLAKTSDNPLVRSGVVNPLEGFHNTGVFAAWINDMQETGNPLLQIITSNVMADIRAKEMKGIKLVKEFRNKVAAIKKKAKDAGVSINWAHIIDDYGRFVQEYNQAFIDRLQELRDEVTSAKIAYGDGSKEHLEKQLEYEKWRLKYTNQMLKDDYYKRRIEIEEYMLKNHSTVYVAYKQLEAKRKDILNRSRNGVLSEKNKKELKKVKQDIDNIVNNYYYNSATNYFENKKSFLDPENTFTGVDRTIYSLESANAISNYLRTMAKLREDYFKEGPKFGFREQLEQNLDIVNSYEMRDNNGNITVPLTELMKHEDYVKAKEWIENNTRYIINEQVQNEIKVAFKNLQENSRGRKLLNAIAKRENAYDSKGTIDATKLTDEEIEQLYEEQLSIYNINENSPFSDKILISNAPTDDTVFSSEFYKNMTTDGAKNQDYIKKVNEINKILNEHYNPFDKTVHTSEMSEEEINALIKLYDELDKIKKKEGSTNAGKVRKFIETEVEFTYDYAKYEQEKDFASQKGKRYLALWRRLNESVVEDGNGKVKVVPNSYIYGYAKPKGYKEDGTGDNTYVDPVKTEALRVIRSHTVVVKTEYYYKKYKEMRAKSKEEFDKWYKANHIYNPYTHTIEPLPCWTKLDINPNYKPSQYEESGMYVPNFNQTDLKPKENMMNPDYKLGKSIANNYRKGNSEYDNNINITEEERELRELFETTIRELSKTNQANRFLDKGYMPSRMKQREVDAKYILQESAKLIGWINTATGKESWYNDDRIDYAYDTTPNMPMLALLKSKDSVEVPMRKPVRNENETLDEYNARLKKFNDDKRKAEKHNAEIHKDLIDKNWESVMEEFIQKAVHYNAVQDNKLLLLFGKNIIDNLDVYVKNVGLKDLKTVGRTREDGTRKYETKNDENLRKQYANWLRRLIYDQYKEANGGFTRGANIVQSLTSAKFMMLNVTGGVANVTVGGIQIVAEALAKEYFGVKAGLLGLDSYRRGLANYLVDIYSDKASSLESAIIKYFNVVDFTDVTYNVNIPNASKYVERTRDALFFTQSSGEHFMQNGVLFTMLHAHRLVQNMNPDDGRLSWSFMNEKEFIRSKAEGLLLKFLRDNNRDDLIERYNEFIKRETEDPNNARSYAIFRKDLTTEFARLYLNVEQRKEFIKLKKYTEDKAKKEFNNDETHPTLFSQLELDKDGVLGFKDDSILSSMGDEAYQLLGRFKGRVISVNKKIHGVYDKLGAAMLERHWYGSLVMQYHKHLYPGIMKRWRLKGYFNEERGTIEKGTYASIKDFLSLPLHDRQYIKRLKAENSITDAELENVQGMQNIVRAYIDFAAHIALNYQLLPEYDKANMRRMLGNFLGVFSALCFAIALRAAADDDDEEGLVYNFMMYEADRLASETAIYNPLGLISESKKLWSSPVAFSNSIEDGLAAAGLVSQWVISGGDFNPTYKSGLYAGENKFEVFFKRNTPVLHSIYMLERVKANNKYYKLGDNILSIVPVKDISNSITGETDDDEKDDEKDDDNDEDYED